MSFINYYLKEINCKIIYFGVSLSGKTSNLKYISKSLDPNLVEDFVCLENNNTSFFFDFLPIKLGEINGYKTKFHLYTISNSSKFESSKKLIFKGLDGIVFLVDSQSNRIEENLEALNNLKKILFEYGYDYNNVPMVIQYNKRDLNNTASIQELSAVLNDRSLKEFEVVATSGKGVYDTFKAISKSVLDELKSA